MPLWLKWILAVIGVADDRSGFWSGDRLAGGRRRRGFNRARR